MAAPKGILALNLGTQTISLAEFQRNAEGGLILTRLKQIEILGDPSADPTRSAQTKLQVEQLVTELGFKGRSVNYAIASHVIFTRPVTLPSVGDATQVEQIVGFEAQQNVPYPIDEVVWDWQLLDAGDGGQVEVILAAIKSDLLDEINASAQAGGLKPAIVDIAPMALYNALRYNYPDAEGCTILVDIGSRTTNLLFCEPGKIFPRRLNIGGSSITTAIAKDFGCAFSEAEVRKVRDGFVSLGGTYAEPDDVEIARISKITRNQMTRLHQEIARSITFYRSEHGGSQPVRVLIAGGTASLPYIREFFQEKFPGMEVDYFNPLRNVAVSDSANTDDLAHATHTLGELVGLALRGLGSCPMELNLRPVSVAKAEKRAAQRPYLIAAGVCVLSALGAWWQYYEHAAVLAGEKADKLNQDAAPLVALEKKMKDARAEVDKLAESAHPLETIAHERAYWVSLLEDLNKRIPKDYIWITNLELQTPDALKKEADAAEPAQKPTSTKGKPKKGGDGGGPSVKLMAKGLFLGVGAGNNAGAAVVDEFVTSLKDSKLMIPSDDANDGFVRPNADTNDWAFKFVIPLKLKNPINLQ
ncbi:MAG: type IV pilus assembly protein PilM [Chthoniobacteraceae bacterium]